jgi:hypothetical protein
MRPGGDSGRGRLDRIEQLRTGQEHYAGARHREHPAAPSGIGIEVMMAALDRTAGNGVGHQPRFRARLDDEQSTDLPEHCHKLTPERFRRSLEPFTP